MANHLFSSGQLYALAAPATAALLSTLLSTLSTSLVPANKIADVQDATLDTAFENAQNRASAQEGRFANDIGFHTGKATLKATVRDVNMPIIYGVCWGITAATQTIGGVTYTTYPIGQATVPQPVVLVYVTQNSAGKQMILVFTKAYVGNPSASFKLTDFTDLTMDFEAISDPNNGGNVITPYMAQ